MGTPHPQIFCFPLNCYHHSSFSTGMTTLLPICRLSHKVAFLMVDARCADTYAHIRHLSSKSHTTASMNIIIRFGEWGSVLCWKISLRPITIGDYLFCGSVW